jgi:hypothetical protein
MLTAELTPIATIRSKSDRTLTVYQGYDDNVIEQLVTKSKEEDIMRRCPKDAAKRFSSPEAFRAWVNKGVGGRALYPVLDDETRDLGLVLWLGIEKFEGEAYREEVDGVVTDKLLPGVNPVGFARGRQMTDTFALRSYESQKGQGLSRAATIHAIARYAVERSHDVEWGHPQLTGIHLETDIDNLPSRKVYQNMLGKANGFSPIVENLDKNRIAMVLPEARLGAVVAASQAMLLAA